MQVKRGGYIEINLNGNECASVKARPTRDGEPDGDWGEERVIYDGDIIHLDMTYVDSFDIDQINGEVIVNKPENMVELDEKDKIRLRELQKSTYGILNELCQSNKADLKAMNNILRYLHKVYKQQDVDGPPINTTEETAFDSTQSDTYKLERKIQKFLRKGRDV